MKPKKAKKLILAALDEWLEDKLKSKVGQRQIVEAVHKRLDPSYTQRSFSQEDEAVKTYVHLSKPGDDIWRDYTAAEITEMIFVLNPKLQGQLSTVKMGKALTRAGAMKIFRSGIARYKINSITKPKKKKNKS